MSVKQACLCLFLALFQVQFSAGMSLIDCSFESNGTYTRCGYRIGWDGMTRANWKFVTETRDKKICKDDHFAYFEARRRPRDFSARLYTPVDRFHDDDCVTFSYVNKGPRRAYPNGRMKLEVYFMPGGREIVKTDIPLWTSTGRTGRNRWKTANVAIAKQSNGQSLVGSIAFTAIRGGSKRAYVAIDDIAVNKCRESATGRVTTKAKKPFIIRALPARRPIQTRNFTVTFEGAFPTPDPVRLAHPPRRRTSSSRSRRRDRKRNKNRNRKPKDNIGYVYLPENQIISESNTPFVPQLVGQSPSQEEENAQFVPIRVGQERPQAECDFLQYTKELRSCLRAFFSMLRRHKSKRKCNADYTILESCLKQVATKCVPASDMPAESVHEIITDTLQNKFKTQQVYCLEEGAFVYPEFSLGSIPLQCSPMYFGKLTSCGGAFSGIFNFKHGDPSLCREYFQANECQRRTTAKECEFDTRSQLIYGLNLQYQFAHNPFCIDLPFSAWWPDQ